MDEGEVSGGDHARCLEDDDNGEGIELPKGEEAAMGRVSGGGNQVVVLCLLNMDVAMDGEGVELPEGEEATMGGVSSNGCGSRMMVLYLLFLYMMRLWHALMLIDLRNGRLNRGRGMGRELKDL